MVNLIELKAFEPVEEVYLEAFPAEERRELSHIAELIGAEDRYHILGVQYLGAFVGLISYWEIGDWVFGEHFAVDASCRGKGVGASAMELFMADKERLIIEVEPPVDVMAMRRVGFYERLGFKLWDIPYFQPPYRAGDAQLPFCLMTNGVEPTEELISEIHRVVYK